MVSGSEFVFLLHLSLLLLLAPWHFGRYILRPSHAAGSISPFRGSLFRHSAFGQGGSFLRYLLFRQGPFLCGSYGWSIFSRAVLPHLAPAACTSTLLTHNAEINSMKFPKKISKNPTSALFQQQNTNAAI